MSVVRPTITTASGTWRTRISRAVAGPEGAPARLAARALAAETTWPAQAPIMCPPTTAASWIVQTSPGGSHDEVGSKKAVPKRFSPCCKGSEIAMTIRWPSMSR